MPSFDQVVTQWMSPSYVDARRAWISSHDQLVGCSTRPSTLNDHASVVTLGVASAVRTGQVRPVSYWPGGSRGSRAAWPRPPKPRVNFTIGVPFRTWSVRPRGVDYEAWRATAASGVAMTNVKLSSRYRCTVSPS